MSTFSGDIGREEEDGGGWEGLVPDREERRERKLAKLARDRAEVEESRQPLREALKVHWLSQIECNHYEKNDSAICACGWKSDRGFNVGKAVELWIDHVFAEVEESGKETSGR